MKNNRIGHKKPIKKTQKNNWGLHPFTTGYLSIDARRRHGLPFMARGICLWGAVGQDYWRYFLQYHRRASRRFNHPLDNWSQTTLQKIARPPKKNNADGGEHNIADNKRDNRAARKTDKKIIKKFHQPLLLFPFSHRMPRQRGNIRSSRPVPFQSLAQTIGFTPSPLGLLIHPQFGLWVGFRGAVATRAIPKKIRHQSPPSPCVSCTEKPCIAACPAGAVTANGFVVDACHDYLTKNPNCDCLRHGCLARHHCPIGTEFRYNKNQSQFFWRSMFGR